MSAEPPYFGKYRGTVINTLDPLRLARLQAVVPDVVGAAPTTWATPSVPYAGPGAGIVALPPVGAGVWIEFEQGDPDPPIRHLSGLLVFAIAAGVAGGCTTTNLATPATCSRIGSLPGPEDFELHVTGAAARLIVSSQSRGAGESARGGLFEVALAPGGQADPVPLHLTGRGTCSFHPHGISMVIAESGELLLYVSITMTPSTPPVA